MIVCLLLLLFNTVGTDSAKYNLSEIPDNDWAINSFPVWVDQLSSNNYTNEGHLGILDTIAKYLYKWNEIGNVRFSVTLVDYGLLRVFDTWLDHFQLQSENDLSKNLFGKLFQILYNGAKLDKFSKSLLQTGVLKKALHLTMKFEVLFGDLYFAEDIRTVAYGTCWNIYFFASAESTKSDLISVATSVYGERFKEVDKLNSAKHSEMYQLYKGKLLALLEPTETEMDERYTLERPVLLKLREKYLEEIKFRKGNFKPITYHLITDLVFEEWHLYYYDIFTLFNNLLMSKANTIQLCDNKTFEHYLMALEIYTHVSDLAVRLDLDRFLVRAIWGLTILQHSCSHGEQYYNQHMRDNLKLLETYQFAQVVQESKALLSYITSETKFCANGSLTFHIEQIGVRPVCGDFVGHSSTDTTGLLHICVGAVGAYLLPGILILIALLCVKYRARISTCVAELRENPDRQIAEEQEMVDPVPQIQMDFDNLVLGVVPRPPLAVGNPNYFPYVRISDEPRLIPSIPMGRLTYCANLANGRFGSVSVMKFNFPGIGTQFIAAKKARAAPEFKKMLLAEKAMMAELPLHINVLKLLAVSTDADGTLYLITQHCRHGTMFQVLAKPGNTLRRTSFQPKHDVPTKAGGTYTFTMFHLYSWAYQLVDGMNCLAGHNIVHSDLKLENILFADGFLLKIGDFGLTNQSTKFHDQTQIWVPKEAAPEARENGGNFTTMSDVYSLGVVLWFLFQFSVVQYEAFLNERSEVQDNIVHPRYACANVYQLILECLQVDPRLRPTFRQCRSLMEEAMDHVNPPLLAATQRDLERHADRSAQIENALIH